MAITTTPNTMSEVRVTEACNLQVPTGTTVHMSSQPPPRSPSTMGPSTANLDMKPSMGTDHHKSLLLNHLRPEGAILSVHDFHRRMRLDGRADQRGASAARRGAHGIRALRIHSAGKEILRATEVNGEVDRNNRASRGIAQIAEELHQFEVIAGQATSVALSNDLLR